MWKIDLNTVQSATSETAREINRRIVLNLVRTRQPISRADLARVSGLQRSTVSLIAEELINAEWITEGPTGRLPRGRRPTYLRLNDQRSIIGVDIRPGATTVAISDVNGRFSSQECFPTPGDAEDGIAEIVLRIRRLTRGRTFEGIGVSLPGRVDPERRRLVFAPNLRWRDCDIRTPLERASHLDVELENAANASALAELWFGHYEYRDFIVVTVSEGIGAGILANGQLLRGSDGMAGEFGHTIVVPGGELCSCGNRGCWEQYASNTAALRYHGAAGMSFQDLLSLAGQANRRAVAALEEMARYLGRGAAMLATGLAPSAIVFVGELTRAWSSFEPVIAAEMAKYTATPHRVRLVAADDGSAARLRGTAALILQKHFGAPALL